MRPAAEQPPAAASGALLSALSPSGRPPQPGAGPLPTRPPTAAASGLTERPGYGSSAESAHDPLAEPHTIHHHPTVVSHNNIPTIVF